MCIRYRVRYKHKNASISKFQETNIVCIRYRVRFAFMHDTISHIIITDIKYSLFDIEAYSISEPDIVDLVFDIVVSTISYVFSTRDIEALNRYRIQCIRYRRFIQYRRVRYRINLQYGVGQGSR